MSTIEDNEIVDLFLARDEKALEYISEKFGKKLCALSYNITSDIGASEECVNDTYLEAWNLIPPNEPRTYLFAFLAKITKHISIDVIRKQNSYKRVSYIEELSDELKNTVPAPDGVEDIIEAKALGEAINRYLMTVDTEKRVIFVKRYFYLQPIAEISRSCLISESKVKTVLFRLRAGLQKYLIKEGLA